jgi:ribosome-associated translation inhibitor RaiA
MPIELTTPKTHLSPETTKRIQHHLDSLDRRLVKFANAATTVNVRERATERRFTADIRLAPGVDSVELVSHQSAETPEAASRLAVEDIERQLERFVATLRGEPAFGTPSRREPKVLRPANTESEPDDGDLSSDDQ